MRLSIRPLWLVLALWLLLAWPAAAAAPTEGKLAAGYFHNCAIVAGGQVKCWGLGQQGQLGNGRLASSAVPQTVKGLSGVKELIGGYHWTCARLGDGSLRCWGATKGRYAAAPDRKKVKKCRASASVVYDCVAEPIGVSGVSKVKALGASGNFLYAIRENGQVVAVDLGDHPETPAVQTLSNLSGVEQVDGFRSSGNTPGGCVRTATGQAICWNGGLSLYGDYKPDCEVRPAVCSIESEGQSFGLTGEDAVGFCKTRGELTPEWIKPMRWSCKQAASGEECTYVESGLADSSHFQALFLQDSSARVFYPERVFTDPQHPSNCEQPLSVELEIRPIEGVAQLSYLTLNSGEGAYALGSDGTALFWGENMLVAGFLPKETPRSGPITRDGPLPRAGLGLTRLPQLQGAIQIKENAFTGCALWPSGEVRCWGDQRGMGLVGNGQATGFVPAPVKIALPPVQVLSQGDYHNCALLRDGRVFCWGNNEDGILGPAAKGKFSARPVAIPGLKVAL
ncbi:MAG: RCC1 domain-containing protein [Candidatus Sericytochromatia bacterium]